MSNLELSSICKYFGAVSAVENISLSVSPGSRLAIVGASGSGKTTLLRMIAGFECPDSGSITLSGETLIDEGIEVPAHRRTIGYVPQDGALFPHMTVADNIGFGLPGKTSSKRQRVQELMDTVSLDPQMLKRWPHELSGGQQQRVALARALAQRPKLMLLDEPFSALDTGLRTATRKAVTQLLNDAGITTILVTHDQREALSFGDQLAIMRQGRLVQMGDPQHLYLYPEDEEAALFLGDAIIAPASLANGWATCELGRVAINNKLLLGKARIMLRPEQLQLSTELNDRTDLPRARVVDVDYGGSSSMLTLNLQASGHPANQGAQPIVLSVRCTELVVPRPGNLVSISINGHAHVLP